MQVLAGDIGGTKTALAIAEVRSGRLSFLRSRNYASAAYPGLEEIARDFLSTERRRPTSAAFGIAGPVRGGRAEVTKLPWSIDERQLARRLGIRRVRLVNDFIAAALGIPRLSRSGSVVLLPGEAESDGPIGVIGAGTGLGQAVLVRVDGDGIAVASEGGHADFGPRDEREDRLVRFVRKGFGRVDRDRLLSGEGLGHIYDFVKFDHRASDAPAVARAFPGNDRAAVISRFALSGRDALCREALSLFVSIYGSEAGNLALQYRATGGVYLAGGIAPKILPALRRRSFRDSFRSKSPLEAFLSRIPVRVVLEPKLGLLGAAATAYRIAIETTR
ncbi:MAG: glucokinase [Acidobacteria bacterium]|nr:MAG: glucokinase [Acidobacteriota bacterium]